MANASFAVTIDTSKNTSPASPATQTTSAVPQSDSLEVESSEEGELDLEPFTRGDPSIPIEAQIYGGWNSEFDSYETAMERLNQPRWVVDLHGGQDDVPEERDFEKYAKKLYEAATDLNGFFDKAESKTKPNRIIKQVLPKKQIMMRCFQAVVSSIPLSR